MHCLMERESVCVCVSEREREREKALKKQQQGQKRQKQGPPSRDETGPFLEPRASLGTRGQGRGEPNSYNIGLPSFKINKNTSKYSKSIGVDIAF